jgi:glutathione synthase/RimK-type ligase-like ATP-grasp enzyme
MTRAANRNRAHMKGSLRRKVARQQRENEAFSADTAHAVSQPERLTPNQIAARKKIRSKRRRHGSAEHAMGEPEVLTEKQAQALARSDAIRLRIDGERAAKKLAEAEKKKASAIDRAWLEQNKTGQVSMQVFRKRLEAEND